MAIRITCKCGKVYDFRDDLEGRRAACPSCTRIMVIVRSASDFDPSHVVATCECGQSVRLQSAIASGRPKCPACGKTLVVHIPATARSQLSTKQSVPADQLGEQTIPDVCFVGTQEGDKVTRKRRVGDLVLADDKLAFIYCYLTSRPIGANWEGLGGFFGELLWAGPGKILGSKIAEEIGESIPVGFEGQLSRNSNMKRIARAEKQRQRDAGIPLSSQLAKSRRSFAIPAHEISYIEMPVEGLLKVHTKDQVHGFEVGTQPLARFTKWWVSAVNGTPDSNA
jgi:hypothetical protein